jgi:hypothetical protein
MLIEVNVLKTRTEAKNRPRFAHELVHVDQYLRLGITSFARRFAANSNFIEEEVRAKARPVVPS